jgi:CBS domain containing-hemolysin-like protein
VVGDPASGTLGMITLEDVLESVVGEIVDESDRDDGDDGDDVDDRHDVEPEER